MHDSDGSITRLIPGLRGRDELAIETLWRRYVQRVEAVARPVVAGVAAGAGDAQDVAQSAFHAFCEAAADGGAPHLGSRNELWRLLAAIARNKAADRARRERRQRRGGGVAASVSVAHLAARESSPSQNAELQEMLDSLLAHLDATGDPRLRSIALLRLEGATTSEIATVLQCAPRTIQRKLHILERLWWNCET